MSLDQFYTKPEIAKKCCELIDFSQYDSILEPSAGAGAFLEFLPDHTNAVDIDPKIKGIKKQDFLTYQGTENL